MQKNNWTFKDKLEITEDIFTIVVSVMAIWGTLIAWENGFWHKVKHIADHLHDEYNVSDTIHAAEKKVDRVLKDVQKTL